MAETGRPDQESKGSRAGSNFVQAVEWVLKAGSAFAIWLAIAAAFHLWPFGEAPDVRIDIAASQVNSEGYDNASDEYICLVNMSGDDVDLLGWELRDAEGSVNILPDLTLAPAQHLRVHPGGGKNSKSDVYGEGQGVAWNNQGDTATLLDDSGNVIDSQTYGSRSSETVAASCASS
ncbi:MAG TPA: lamin tail domain-containing protein [Solirubrobacterales bacterium]|nr:lamin tail domain-containing protein [Solirubrobacterales bacterium]